MTMKKLQVFVSSTYLDLKAERQAAVEAILTTGHIPAGMELFAAGDKTQVDVIRRWIDESDLLLLILGGRYGSLDNESGKSYTQLEYEYALEKGKPVFSVVITESHLNDRIRSAQNPKDVLEQEHPQLLRKFRDLVTARMVRFWSSSADIKLAIHESLAQFARREDLGGWVRWTEIGNLDYLRDENRRLAVELQNLRQRLAGQRETSKVSGEISTDEMVAILMRRPLEEYSAWALESFFQSTLVAIQRSMMEFGHDKPTALHLLWGLRRSLAGGLSAWYRLHPYLNDMFYLGLLLSKEVPDDEIPGETMTMYTLSGTGRSFLLALEAKLAAAQQ